MKLIKCLLLLWVITLVSCTHNIATNFRGLEFGQSNPTEDMILDSDHGALKKLVRANDSLKIGSAQVQKITYSFCNNKLSEVWVIYNGRDNYQALLQSLTEEYGMSFQSRSQGAGILSGAFRGDTHLIPSKPEEHMWGNSDIRIMLVYDKNGGTLSLQYFSLINCPGSKKLFE
jgi:hypothetical protein